MLLNITRIALRHLNRQKIHTGFHLAGLTLGMTACLLIGLFLCHELSFDGYHEKADRIYWKMKGEGCGEGEGNPR